MNISSMFTSKISSIPEYQQQSGQSKSYKTFLHPASVQHTQTSMFANHPFQRTFASVVSCKTPILQKSNDNLSQKVIMKSNNDGILNCILKKFTIQKRSSMLPPKVPYFESSSHVQKEFEDFTTLPTTYLQHNNNNQRTTSAKINSQSMQNTNNNNKNRHEKHRHSIEHDIRVDCDIFNIKKVNNCNNNSQTLKDPIMFESDNLPKKSINPPFEIQSLKEFPAISPPSTTTTTSHDQTANVNIMSKAKTSTDETDEGDYVKFHDDIAKTTPTFVPRRYNLCEKVSSIVKSPKKLLSIPMMSPKRSCLKPTMRRTRTISECSDDFIVFDRSCCDGSNSNIDNIDSESEFDDDESDISDEEEDDSDDDMDDDCLDGNNNQHLLDILNNEIQQPDSGVEEKKVHFNLVPKVHTIVAWNYAYRQARRGDIWRQGAVDRERFSKRISECSKSLNPILDRDHRNRIFEDRFRESEAH